MFILTKMRSVVRLEPINFERDLPDALSDALTEKLANKVLKDVGLVIALWDILSIGDSYLFPGDGASHTRVEFRILVFRPFMEEVLVGKVRQRNKTNPKYRKHSREDEASSKFVFNLIILTFIDKMLYKRRCPS